MGLEIVGSRLLAPVFGSSLFVWGALIGVVLAAMSTGYAAGGWLADRYPPQWVIAGLLLASGGWTLLLAWAGQPVVFQVFQWIQDPRWGPCFAASALLGIPAFGLSGVLPALLRLAIADMGHLGRHTGGMIAVSTMGSLIGTWGTSFYLINLDGEHDVDCGARYCPHGSGCHLDCAIPSTIVVPTSGVVHCGGGDNLDGVSPSDGDATGYASGR